MEQVQTRFGELRTAKNGYDKTQVQLMMRQLQEEVRTETENLRTQMDLRVENAEKECADWKAQAEHLDAWVAQLTQAWEHQTEYNRQRDEQLRQYHMREQVLSAMEETARKQAQEIKRKSEEQARVQLDKAQASAVQTMKAAQCQSEAILEEARQNRDRIESEASAAASGIVERAHQQAAEILQAAQREREAIVAESTTDIRRIREEHCETMRQVVDLLQQVAKEEEQELPDEPAAETA